MHACILCGRLLGVLTFAECVEEKMLCSIVGGEAFVNDGGSNCARSKRGRRAERSERMVFGAGSFPIRARKERKEDKQSCSGVRTEHSVKSLFQAFQVRRGDRQVGDVFVF